MVKTFHTIWWPVSLSQLPEIKELNLIARYVILGGHAMDFQNKKQVFLSYSVTVKSPNPPAIPSVEISSLYRLANGDAANVFVIKLANHTGTHVDAPAHVIEGGVKISEFFPEELLFRSPVLIDLQLGDGEIVLPSHLECFLEKARAADMLLCRFGYGAVRREAPNRYSCKCPGFGIASATMLLNALPNLRAIGMDVPSLACIAHLEETMEAHNILLRGAGRRFMVIEDMNLEGDLDGLSSVWVAPWQVADIDSSPCTVIGWLG